MASAESGRVTVPDRPRCVGTERAGVLLDARRRCVGGSRRSPPGDRHVSIDPDVVSNIAGGPSVDGNVVGIPDALTIPSFQSILPTIVDRRQIGAGLA